ncbi:hypothetical protein VTN77DRAFT_4677 [Rasamsonia byssochlamydoides]|uniref:uncharacterized protein n=1 Tax=Rasamsonia byssochlamydoides TaxID=89139 RepID=UPI0037422A66
MLWAVIPLLRVAPVVTSTSLLIANLDQVFTFQAWLQPSLPSPANGKVLPYWYDPWYNRSVPMLGVLVLLSIGGGVGNLTVGASGLDNTTWRLYSASLACTLAHGLFSTLALEQIRNISKKENAGEGNLTGLRKWLVVNRYRFIVSEIPAFIAAVLAVIRVIKD